MLYKKSACIEREVKDKLQSLLPDGFKVMEASKYTGNEKEFPPEEKLSQPMPDFYIEREGIKIAALEVSAGVPGWTYAKSKYLNAGERKVKTADRERANFPSYMIYVLEIEPKDKPCHFLWIHFDIIRECPKELERKGRGYMVTEYIYHIDIKLWNLGMESFIEELKRPVLSYS